MFVKFYILVTLVYATCGNELLMEEQRFCGDSILQTLQRFCTAYYTPDHRAKRQVVDECCRRTCSIHHLMSNYCESYDREEVIKYLQERKRRLNGEVGMQKGKEEEEDATSVKGFVE